MKDQDFFFYYNIIIFTARCEDTIFIFHVLGYWCGHGYQMNIIIQLQ